MIKADTIRHILNFEQSNFVREHSIPPTIAFLAQTGDCHAPFEISGDTAPARDRRRRTHLRYQFAASLGGSDGVATGIRLRRRTSGTASLIAVAQTLDHEQVAFRWGARFSRKAVLRNSRAGSLTPTQQSTNSATQRALCALPFLGATCATASVSYDAFTWAALNLGEAKANKASNTTVAWRYAILRIHEVVLMAAPKFNNVDLDRLHKYFKTLFVDYATVPTSRLRGCWRFIAQGGCLF